MILITNLLEVKRTLNTWVSEDNINALIKEHSEKSLVSDCINKIVLNLDLVLFLESNILDSDRYLVINFIKKEGKEINIV